MRFRHVLLASAACVGFLLLFARGAAPTVRVDQAAQPRPAPASAGEAPAVKNMLAILWDPHRPANPAPSSAYIEDQLFGEARSVRDYYLSQSGGRVEIRNAGVLGWYDAGLPAEFYWSNPVDVSKGFSSGYVEKWLEALRRADAEFDFSAYDANGDGDLTPDELGILIVIPQSIPFGDNRPGLVPYIPTTEPILLDGVIVHTISEVLMGLDTDFSSAAHETGHLLFGLPDMYGSAKPAGPYSLMDVGYQDSQLDAYNKYWLGWVTARTISEDGSYAVSDVEKSREILKIVRPSDPKEFFLIENRQHGRYDTKLPATGIVVWGVYDERHGDWGRDNVWMIRSPGGQDGELRLKWRDGSDSGITLKDFPASSPSMRIYIALP